MNRRTSGNMFVLHRFDPTCSAVSGYSADCPPSGPPAAQRPNFRFHFHLRDSWSTCPDASSFRYHALTAPWDSTLVAIAADKWDEKETAKN